MREMLKKRTYIILVKLINLINASWQSISYAGIGMQILISWPLLKLKVSNKYKSIESAILILFISMFITSLSHGQIGCDDLPPNCPDYYSTPINLDSTGFVPLCGVGAIDIEGETDNNSGCGLNSGSCGPNANNNSLNCHEFIFYRSNNSVVQQFNLEVGSGGCNGELDASYVSYVDQSGNTQCSQLSCRGSQTQVSFVFPLNVDSLLFYLCVNSSAAVSVCGLCIEPPPCDSVITCLLSDTSLMYCDPAACGIPAAETVPESVFDVSSCYPDLLLTHIDTGEITCVDLDNDNLVTITRIYTLSFIDTLIVDTLVTIDTFPFEQCVQIINIYVPDSILSVSCTGDTLSCFGDSNGVVNVIASGGTEPYSYVWSTGDTTALVSGLPSGVYTVIVTDSMGCMDTCSAVITEPDNLIINCFGDTVNCVGDTNGTVQVNASGGTPPYNYLWSSGDTTATVSNLSPNVYSVTVTDANGCSTICSTVIADANPLIISCSATDVLCQNITGTGTASVTIIGNGAGGLTYLWNDTAGQTTPTAIGLGPGTYTVTVTDANGCTTSCSTTVDSANALTISCSATDVSCNGGADGTATVIVISDGAGNPTYLWSDTAAQTTPTAVGLGAGSYTVTVTDANGCTTQCTVIISEPVPLTCTIDSILNETCNEFDNGFIIVSGDGGPAPYVYDIGDGVTNTDGQFNGLAAGTYSITVTDANGCTTYCIVDIDQPDPLVCTLIQVTAGLCGEVNNGTIEVIASGGTSPYVYDIGGGITNTDGQFSGLALDTFSITITDANGCTTTCADIIIVTPEPLTCVINGSTNETCNEFNDGTINVSANGGTSPYIYDIGGGNTNTDGHFTGLAAGTYSITITDAVGCTTTCSDVIITQPDPLTCGITSTNETCNEFDNGTVTVTASGGTSPYVYDDGATTNTDGIFTGLAAGTYNVTITDANGCTTTCSAVVTQPAPLTCSITSTNETCNEFDDGTVTITASGGTSPYVYDDGTTTNTDGIFTGLAAGTYNVTITDANGCTTTCSAVVTQPDPLTCSITSASEICNEFDDGTVTATASGGTSPYVYDDGTTTNTDGVFTGLAAGTYNVTITDANGCTTTCGAVVMQPDPLTCSITSTNETCNEFDDGTVTATAIGGTSPYVYDDGTTTNTDGVFTSLAAGTYNVTITDANGCTTTCSAVVTQPDPLTCSITSTNETCNEFDDGTVTATAIGGTSPYVYDDGTTTNTDGVFTGLAAGTYNITITDANGCTTTCNAEVTQPDPLTCTITIMNETCNEFDDGTVTATAIGGTSSYVYDDGTTTNTDGIFTGLAAGTYNITITDANGCTTTCSTEVTQPDPLTCSITSTNETCNEFDDGMVTATASGGTSPYVYDDGTTTNTDGVFTGLAAGTYNITITDANGCTTTCSAEVTQPDPLTCSITSTNETCNEFDDGTITATASGGTSPYVYNNGTTTNTDGVFTGLAAGTYNITITDANGCTTTCSAELTQPDPLVCIIDDVTNETCNESDDGTISLSASGGTSPYVYDDGGGVTNSDGDFIDLAAGTYSITITDANGCTTTCSAEVTQPEVLICTISNIIPESSITANDGSFDLTISGGTTPYVYVVLNSAMAIVAIGSSATDGGTETVSMLDGDIYTVNVTDANGCMTSCSVDLRVVNYAIDKSILIGPTPTGVPNQFEVVYEILVSNIGTIDTTYDLSDTLLFGIGATIDFDTVEYGMTGENIQDGTINGLFDGVTDFLIVSDEGLQSGFTETWNITVIFTVDLNTVSDSSADCNLTGLETGTGLLNYAQISGGVASVTDSVCAPIPMPAASITKSVDSLPTPTGNPHEYVMTYIVTVANTGNAVVYYDLTDTLEYPTGVTIVSSTAGYDSGEGLTSSINPGFNGQTDFLIIAGETVDSGQVDNFIITVVFTVDVSMLVGDEIDCEITVPGTASGLFNTATIGGDILVASDTACAPVPLECIVECVVTSTPVSCAGGIDGTLTVQASEGSGQYEYSLDSINFQSDSVFIGLSAGTYTTYVRDILLGGNNCVTSCMTVITQPAPLTCSIVSTNETCNEFDDGTITVVAGGGTSPYVYDDGTTTNTDGSFTGLAAGTYSITITDANGCTTTCANVIITQPDPLTCTFGSSTNETCNEFDDGTITVVAGGGTSPYVYDDGTTTNTDGSFTGLAAGTYSITITDANGCTTTCADVMITQPDPLACTFGSSTNETCNEFDDGTITVVAGGGTSPYVYYDGTTTNTDGYFTGLAAGTYSLTITDANGCTTTCADIMITQPDPLTCMIMSSNEACNEFDDGTITVVAGGGTSPYVYNDGTTTNTDGSFTGLAAGTYSITITDANGCTTTCADVMITQPDPLTCTFGSSSNETCNEFDDGTITVVAGGGTSPYVYDDGTTTNTDGSFTGLAAGTYSITITDANGCTTTCADVMITQPNPLTCTFGSSSNETCNEFDDGTITVVAGGGTSPYVYDDGTTTNTDGSFTGLAAGTYSITITDANGCTTTCADVIITQPDPLTCTFGSSTNETCNEFDDGTITVVAGGGTSPYVYDDGTTTNTDGSFTGLAAGTYSITITDANGCTTTCADVIITQPDPLTCTFGSSSNETCNEFDDGTITVAAGGGTSPYVYDDGTTTNTDGSFTGLAASTYSITITDANGCTTTCADVIITQPDPLTCTFGSSTNETCNEFDDGTITVVASGGTSPYVYDDGTTTNTDGFFTGLAAGTYSITITDANGCTTTCADVMITQPDPLTCTFGSSSNETCNEFDDGTITVVAGGGTSPYVYDDGTTTNTDGSFTGLAVGTYSITITDANGCTTTCADVIITQPDPLTCIFGSSSNETCNEFDDGTITVVAGGGTSPYVYDDGTTTNTDGSFTGLAAGTYSITITDANGCTTTCADVIITQPDPLTCTFGSSTNETCNEFDDGTITVVASGGTSPYVYDDGTTTNTDGSFTGLAAGTYSITITDANGCTTTCANVIITQPDPLTCTFGSSSNETCNEFDDGTITVVAGGGTSPYVYDDGTTTNTDGSFTGLAAGTYSITITDANGCTTTCADVIITQPDPLTCTFGSSTNETCNEFDDGTITVVAGGGTSPYVYDDGTTTNTDGSFTGLAAGTYSITITDANGCTTTCADVNITQSDPLTCTFGSSSNETCNEFDDGTITVVAGGGTSPYVYDDGTTTNTDGSFTGLAAGTYSITITDANGCTTTCADVIITQPDPLTCTFGSSTNETCNEFDDGTITVVAGGGTSPYVYDDGTTTNTDGSFTGLAAGTYSITITDANGCTTTCADVIITQPDPLTCTFGSSSNETCNEFDDGTITVVAGGGTSPYVYDDGTTTNTDGSFTGLAASTYSITITDANGCTTTCADVIITQPDPLTCTFGSSSNETCNEFDDGTITVVASGGTSPYVYDDGTTTNTDGSFTGLAAGTYSITITDANGCTTTCANVIITQPDPLTCTFGSSSNETCNEFDDGTITVVAGGGTSPYVYDDGTTTNTDGSFTGLAAGTYSITITDANGCTTTCADVIITQLDPLTCTFGSSTNETCNEFDDGTITVVAGGGTSPYVYDDGTTTNTDGSFTGLAAGTYSITITDANGCTTTCADVNITQSDPLTCTFGSSSNETCNEFDDGTITVVAGGGTSPYVYDDGTTTNTDGSFTGLAAGTYSLTITDANGCTTTCADIMITQPDPLTCTFGSSSNETCNEFDDGTITVVAGGGTSPYVYDNGTMTNTVGSFTGLEAGTYSITITDANGCTTTCTDVIITQPDLLTCILGNSTNETCNEFDDGTIIVSAGGGTSPYIYDDGTTTNTDGSFTGLSAGTYNITITDANGCTVACSDIFITQPEILICTISNIVPETDIDSDDGSFDLTISGGTTPYVYSVMNSLNQVIAVGASFTDGGTVTVSGLDGDIYTVSITDANGCVTTCVVDLRVVNYSLNKSIMSGPLPTGNSNEYLIVYNLVVSNIGTIDTAYNLSDTLLFGLGINVEYDTVEYGMTGENVQSGVLNPSFDGETDFLIVSGEGLQSGFSESWILTVLLTVDPNEATSESVDCSLDVGETGTGLLNYAALSGGVPFAQDSVCSSITVTDVSIEKTIMSGVTSTGNPNEFSITYLLEIKNNGLTTSTFDLSDTLMYGIGIDPISTTIDYLTGDGESGTPNPGFNGLSDYLVTESEMVSSGRSDSFGLTVIFIVDPEHVSDSSVDCTLTGDEDGTGLLNYAQISGGVETMTDSVCTSSPMPGVSINKEIISPTKPTGNLYEFKIEYLIAIVNTGDAIATYDLSDTLRFGLGITPISVEASYRTGDGESGTPNLGFDGMTNFMITDNETVDVGLSDSFSILVIFNVDPDIATDADTDCELALGEHGTGLLNYAEVNGDVLSRMDSICAPLIIPPLAVNDTIIIPSNTSVITTPLNNDVPGSNPLDPSSVDTIQGGGPTNGSVIINSNGTIDYIPLLNFAGLDSIIYAVCDSTQPVSLCDTAVILVTVTAGPPLAVDDAFITTSNSSITTSPLINDIPGSHPLDPVSLDTIPGASPTNGVVVINGDGTIDYNPNPNFVGLDSFEYVVCDSTQPSALCDSATVIIFVTPTQDSLFIYVPVDSLVEVCLDTSELPGNLNVLISCQDPTNGGALSNPNSISGCIDYTAGGTSGSIDTFCVVVCDDLGFCDTTIVIATWCLPPSADAGPDQMVFVDTAIMTANDPGDGVGMWTLISGLGNIINPGDSATTITDLGYGANIFRWTITGNCTPAVDSDTIEIIVSCPQILNIHGTPPSDTFQADVSIFSDATIETPKTVTYRAGNEIILDPNFEVILGAEFDAIIGPCGSSLNESDVARSSDNEDGESEKQKSKGVIMQKSDK